jgi:Zn-dependent peptidase ImmA (M78 family)/transcriptional regulator with XRE-family HTH domain
LTNRLRAYRAIEGINQEELARILGISPQMVSAVESGRRELSADLALLDYSNERMELPDMSEPLHRQRASTKVAASARARELLRLGGEVFGDLRHRTPKVPPVAPERVPAPPTFEEVEDLATDVRLLMGQEEHGPIQNLTSAVERAGVCLIPIAGLHGIDGLSSWVGEEQIPVIGISPAIPGDRFRFTLAHELGHLIMHKKKGDQSEHEANRFAGALLFPAPNFKDAMPETPHLKDFTHLKSSWGVAVSMLVYRAHELDYIDDKRYRALQIQMSKWRKSEPATFSPAYGQLFPKVIEVNGGPEEVGRSLGVNRKHLATTTRWQHLHVA